MKMVGPTIKTKRPNNIKKKDTIQMTQKLDNPIDVTDESYDAQLKMKDLAGLKVGEV